MRPFLVLTVASVSLILLIEVGFQFARKQMKVMQSDRARSWRLTEKYLDSKTSYQVAFDDIVGILNKVERQGLRADVYKLTLRLASGVLPLLSTVAGSAEGQTLLAIGASICSLILLVFGSVAASDASNAAAYAIRKNILNYFAESSGYDGAITESTRFKLLVRSVNTALDSAQIGATADAGGKTKESVTVDRKIDDVPRPMTPVQQAEFNALGFDKDEPTEAAIATSIKSAEITPQSTTPKDRETNDIAIGSDIPTMDADGRIDGDSNAGRNPSDVADIDGVTEFPTISQGLGIQPSEFAEWQGNALAKQRASTNEFPEITQG